MDSKIESAQREADEVKVIMLENKNKAEERKETRKDVNQSTDHLQSADLEKAPKKQNPKMQYLRANKGLVITVLVSAIIIFVVVVAMLATKDMDEHSDVHNDLEKP